MGVAYNMSLRFAIVLVAVAALLPCVCSQDPPPMCDPACGPGFECGAGDVCTDIDECTLDTDGCAQTCTNEPAGSFTCSCDAGYNLNADGKTCDDIDECTMDTDGCAQTCTNEPPGSFTCSCGAGYNLNADGKTCNDIDECTMDTDGCAQTCTNDPPGSFTCSCDAGYTLNADGKTCDDVDECTMDTDGCAQTCTNEPPGSFTCSCGAGYNLNADGKTCDDIDECTMDTDGCAQTCTNDPPGSFTCSCDAGYTLNADGKTCDDINECTLDTDGCAQTCTNDPPGSFTCSCDASYTLNADGKTCDDIDECTLDTDGCAQTCTNDPPGSFTCSCDAGYTLNDDGKTCDDINECDTNNGGCAQMCSNTVGSFTCSCNAGYALNADGSSCDDIDECDTNNGGCEQVCTNSVGSFMCSCNSGYIINSDDSSMCDDINECATNNGGCEHVCSNTDGSYICSCNLGYELATNNHNCVDINECARNTDNCDQLCVNLNGTYKCTCRPGYMLNANERKCDDIDECDFKNGNCSHICTNTPGSHTCSCREGFDKLPAFGQCVGQPCVPPLSAPSNGAIACTGDQVTEETCSFACDAGFTFSGSKTRECLPNHSWTGVDAVCTPKHCTALTDPPNGYVDIEKDCGTILTTACEIKCVEDYFINGTTPFYQTCVANQTSGGVYWTTPPKCEPLDPCQPNPCQHSGQCTQTGMTSFSCNCANTQYHGINCETGVVALPGVPVLSVGQTSSLLWLSAKPDDQITLTFTFPNDSITVTPTQVTISNGSPTTSFTIQALQAGTYLLSYTLSGPSSSVYEDPQSVYILVFESIPAQSSNRYFTTLQQSVGSLVPGCCSSSTSYQCSSSSMATSFMSSCAWMSSTTGGVVFTQGAGLSLPLSIAGSEITLEPNVENSFPNEVPSCASCGGTAASCYHFDFPTNDVLDLLLSRALANTYMERTRLLLPTWLSFNIGNTLLQTTTTFSQLHYQTLLAERDRIQMINSCESIKVDSSGLYSILRHQDSIGILARSVQKNYIPDEGDTPICFAVDLCRGSTSPVHATIPPSAQDTLNSFTEISQYTDKGWMIGFTDATLSRTGISPPLTIQGSYWNGVSHVSPVIPKFDLRLGTTLSNMLTSSDLWIRFNFNGDLFHLANPLITQVEGLLSGSITVWVNTTINGKSASFRMWTNSQPGLFSMPGYLTLPLFEGASFKLQYIPSTEDKFFREVLPLVESEQICSTDSFIKFDNNRELSWMSYTMQCSGLRVSNVLFPAGGLQNRVYLTGSSAPPTPDNIWDGATMKVYTWLTSSSLQLNRYLSIRQPTSGPALSAGYWKNGQQEGRIYQTAFSLLGAYFTAPADIRNEKIRFMSQANIFGSYSCLLSGATQATGSLEDASITISGVFDNSSSSFQQQLQSYLYTFVMTRIEQAEERRAKAQLLLNAAQQRVNGYQSVLNAQMAAQTAAQSTHQQAIQQVTAAVNAVNAAQAVAMPSTQVQTDDQNELRTICEYRNCPSSCIPGANCQICDNQLDFEDRGYCTESSIESLLMYRNVTRTDTKQVYVRQCRRLTLIKGWAMTDFGQVCPYGSKTEYTSFEERESYYGKMSVSHTRSCSLGGSYVARQCCCQHSPCQFSLASLQCVYENAACNHAQRQPTDVRGTLATLWALNSAQEILAVRREQLALAELQLSIHNKLVASAQATHQSLVQALAATNAHFQQVIAAEQPYLLLRQSLMSVPISALAQIQGIRFQVVLQPTPITTLPLQVTVAIPPLNMVLSQSILTDMTAPEELIKRQIANVFLNRLVAAVANNAGRRRRATEVPTSNVQLFERNCATLSNLKQHLMQLNTTLDDVWERSASNIDTVVADITNMANQPLGNITNTISFTNLLSHSSLSVDVTIGQIEMLARNSPSVSGYYSLLSSMSTALQEFRSNLDGVNLIAWQSSLTNMANFSGIACYGFSDCQTVVSNLVQELMQDTPGADLTLLPAAKQAFAELSLLSNLTLEQAKSKIVPMWTIVQWLETTGYWCATPPVITTQPPENVNVNLGEELSISCNASSMLPITYTWSKDRFVLSAHNTNVLTKNSVEWSDDGQYQCLAKNVVATTLSLQSAVKVFQKPAITLSPEDFTTFEADDSGAAFSCNATGRPAPRYEWYRRNVSSSSWYPLANSSSNVLVFEKPRKALEGWYRCRAITDNGYTDSTPARLTILSVSISKLVYPFTFELQVIGSAGNGTGTGTGPVLNNTLIEMAKLALLSTISQHVNLGTAQIENIILTLTPSQTGAVSFILSTTRGFPYNGSIALDALDARNNQMNIVNVRAQLAQLLASGAVQINFAGLMFGTVNNSVQVGDLEYVCPTGTSAQFNNYLCVACQPGYYQTVVDGRQVCARCGHGSYTASEGQTSCMTCPTRTTTVVDDARGIDECLALCQPDNYNLTFGVEPCLPCAERFYQPLYGAKSCIPCPMGSTIPACVVPIASSTPAVVVPSTSPTETQPTDGVPPAIAITAIIPVVLLLCVLLILAVAVIISLTFWFVQRKKKKNQHSPQSSEAPSPKPKPDSKYTNLAIPNPAYKYMESVDNGSEEELAAMKEKDTAITNPAFGEDMNINEDGAANHNTVPLVTVTDEVEVPATNEDLKKTPVSTHSAMETINESSSVHDDNDTVPLVTVVEVPATKEDLRGTPISTRSAKETPISARSAKETPISTRSAKKVTPGSTRSAKKGTPGSARSAKKGTPIFTHSAKEETPVSVHSAKKGTPIFIRSSKEGTPSSTRSAKERTPSSTRSAKEGTPRSVHSAKEAVDESSSVHVDSDTVPLVTVVKVPATKEALKETAVAETQDSVSQSNVEEVQEKATATNKSKESKDQKKENENKESHSVQEKEKVPSSKEGTSTSAKAIGTEQPDEHVKEELIQVATKEEDKLAKKKDEAEESDNENWEDDYKAESETSITLI